MTRAIAVQTAAKTSGRVLGSACMPEALLGHGFLSDAHSTLMHISDQTAMSAKSTRLLDRSADSSALEPDVRHGSPSSGDRLGHRERIDQREQRGTSATRRTESQF